MAHLKSLVIGMTLLLVAPFSHAQHSSSRRVASVSVEKRWTLSDWLAQRDRNRMMDLWLALNSPSPYEFMLGGSYISYTLKPESASPDSTQNKNSLAGEFSAYAQIFGITAEYENNTKENYNDLTGIFNLRLFGNSIQNSFLTLNYGLRTRTLGIGDLNTTDHSIALHQQFGQASLQLYLQKYFGIDGFYRQFLPVQDSDLGDIKGTQIEGGAFIDFDRLRVFGRWYEEKQIRTSPGTTDESISSRSGAKFGIKYFF